MDQHKLKPNLNGVPETMLWTLHNRASEAIREDGILKDPEAVRIYQVLEYDYERAFGPAEPSHAVRSMMFDNELRLFLDEHPDGVIVNLGEGLETQRFRVDGDEALWLSIDLPEAIRIREQFIHPDSRHLHLSFSVLNRAWFDEIPSGRPVFITAQGLLMYLPESEVRLLFQDLSRRFPGAWFAFDTIPGWLSRKTLGKGWKKTPYYTTPVMPWGINRHLIQATLRSWAAKVDEFKDLRWWRFPRGGPRWTLPLAYATPVLNRYMPAITRIRFATEVKRMTQSERG